MFSMKSISELLKNVKIGWKMLSLKEKALWFASTIIPLALAIWGLTMSTGIMEHVFAASVALITVLSVKFIADRDCYRLLTVAKTALFNSITTFFASSFWCISTNAMLTSDAGSALCNFCMGYLFCVLGCLAYAGLKESTHKTKLAKTVLGLVITFFASIGAAILYEGVDDLITVPTWIDEGFYAISQFSLWVLLLAMCLTSVLIASIKIENNITAYKWCKRFGSASFAFITLATGSAYVYDLFNWSYNVNFGITVGLAASVSMLLCMISGIIGSTSERRCCSK